MKDTACLFGSREDCVDACQGIRGTPGQFAERTSALVFDDSITREPQSPNKCFSTLLSHYTDIILRCTTFGVCTTISLGSTLVTSA